MPRLSLLPTLFREQLVSPQFPREPEPDLVMEGDEQVQAYSEAGRIDGVMAASYLFNSARISSTIAGCKRVLDLGCGPATQLAQVAQLNPDTSFVGVDLSKEMLLSAQTHIEDHNLANVELIEGDITSLPQIEDQSFDAVICTMALHHLPTHEHLDSCFAEVSRILRLDGAIYLVDFSRMKSLKSVLFFSYMNRKHDPHLFSLDYERSLRAAFHRDDFSRFASKRLPDNVTHYSTFGIPILQLLKSPDRNLPPETQKSLAEMRQNLIPKYRRELDDQRFFFWLSGLRNDPF
jgi:arsenite methyltransferase